MRIETRLSAAVIIAVVVLAVLAAYRWLSAPPPAASIEPARTSRQTRESRPTHQPTILRAAPDHGQAAECSPGGGWWPRDQRCPARQQLSEAIDQDSLPFLPIPTLDPHRSR